MSISAEWEMERRELAVLGETEYKRLFCVQKHPVSNHMLFYFLGVLLIAVYSIVA